MLTYHGAVGEAEMFFFVVVVVFKDMSRFLRCILDLSPV